LATSAPISTSVVDAIGAEQIKLIFDQSPVPTLVLSPDLTILQANQALCTNTLAKREEILGRPLFEAFPINPNDPEADGVDTIRASLERAAETLGTDIMPAQQYDIQGPDGQWIRKYWSLTHGAVLDAKGELVYLMQQSQDVTEYVTAMKAGVDHRYETAELRARYDQTKLQSAARQQVLLERISADRVRLESVVHAKDEFLQIVSHELKTPITTIRGNAEVMRARNAQMSDEDRQSALCDIEFESLRLSRILDNLLLLARPEMGGTEDAEPAVINRLVNRAADEHRRQFVGREIAVLFEEDSPVVACCVDTYLEQILQNLLTNAEKYSPQGSPITISVGRERDMAHVKVLDSGKGFTADQAAHVFETYYRIADERADRAGLGIGLAVCKRLVEVMEGEIWALSRPEGGAEVGFSLPLAEDDATLGH
jgi:K+-sensing histidine kinase KdpD